MKLLLYCTKAKPYLMKYNNGEYKEIASFYNKQDLATYDLLNGKIVAECDFEVEELTNFGTSFMIMKYDDLQESYRYTNKIAKGSCLDYTDLRRYLGTNNGYAINIENLHIFDKPKELSDYYKIENCGGMLFTHTLKKAPQNMMRVSVNRWLYGEYEPNDVNILISIKPEWLCKILNGEKTVEVRKKVLKEMTE